MLGPKIDGKSNAEKPIQHLKFKSAAMSLMALAISTSTALAAGVTMNLGLGAPEDSLYGRFAKIFEELECCGAAVPGISFEPPEPFVSYSKSWAAAVDVRQL